MRAIAKVSSLQEYQKKSIKYFPIKTCIEDSRFETHIQDSHLDAPDIWNFRVHFPQTADKNHHKNFHLATQRPCQQSSKSQDCKNILRSQPENIHKDRRTPIILKLFIFQSSTLPDLQVTTQTNCKMSLLNRQKHQTPRRCKHQKDPQTE